MRAIGYAIAALCLAAFVLNLVVFVGSGEALNLVMALAMAVCIGVNLDMARRN